LAIVINFLSFKTNFERFEKYNIRILALATRQRDGIRQINLMAPEHTPGTAAPDKSGAAVPARRESDGDAGRRGVPSPEALFPYNRAC
jgi:hypothetical protein